MKEHLKGSHLYLILWKAFRAIERFDRSSVEEAGFSCFSDFAVLEILWHKGPQTAGAIAQRILLTSGSVTSAIDRLIRRGWVRRERDASDGRVVHVHLTPDGEAVISASWNRHAENLEALFMILSPDERELFYRLNRKIGLHAAALEGNG